MTNEQAVNNVEIKLEYAKRLYTKMENAKIGDDLVNIQDNFVAYLSAFQQCLNYYSNLIASLYPTLETKQRGKINKRIIENWKSNELTSDELKSWNILNKLRNHDTHVTPVQAKDEEINFILTDENDNYIVTEKGERLIVDTEMRYYASYEGKDHNIFELAKYGIPAIEKLIVFIPTITINT